MKIKTKLTKIGRNPLKQKGFINPGTYKGSTMIFNTFKDYLNDIKNFDDRTTFYGINKNPFHKQLEDSISILYNCNDTVLSPSGLGSVSGLTLVGSDLALVNTAAFTSATIGAAKDATVDYDLTGYLSSTMDVTDTNSTAITESVTAAITGTSSSSSSVENNDVEATSNDQTDIVENTIGDVNKIIAFVSVDAIVGSTMSLQLATESTIQPISPTEGLGIQSL